MNYKIVGFRLIFFFSLFISLIANSQVILPKLIADGMVLQRDSDVKIWGWAAVNEKVSVHFNNSVYHTTASESGEWKIILSQLPAGGPFEMIIKATNSIILKDILIGDIWLCSGQSNMELPMKRVSPIYEDEIANSDNNSIRFFTVPQRYNFKEPQSDFESGNWQSANPQSILDFSAVAYFYAKELYEKYHIPIGLIDASLGGSPAEAWISEESLKSFPKHYEEAQRFKNDTLITSIEDQDKIRMNNWYELLNERDIAYKSPSKNWTDPNLNTSEWKTMMIPGYWKNTELGPVNGVVWFKKEIQIPANMCGKNAKLILGRIVDADSVFVNGVFVGTTGYQYPPRRYEIPSGVLKKGKNSIVVRLISNIGDGGFVLDKDYEIIVGDESVNLEGEWQYKLGAKMKALESQTFIRWKPVGLYNSMISPLLNFRIKGVIWYQGESNADSPVEYRTLFPSLITDWRKNWNQGDFPFLFVQLANFMEAKCEPSESNWAMLREAQRNTLSLPNTGMAVTIDIGEWNDIHPLNKRDVGKRLALEAQKIAYNDVNIVSSGPMYKSQKIDGNRIILSFTNTGSGLIAKNNDGLKQFAIAGSDKQFYWAKAKIENDKVVVWNDNVTNPLYVRYAWADNPAGANLYNKEGLPASPFQTIE